MINLNRFIHPLWEKMQSFISNKKVLILIGGSAAGLLLLILLLVISLRMKDNQDEAVQRSHEENPVFTLRAIKQDELFLPREPDFLPDVMLDRDPKTFWTDEDAEQYWKDALNDNPELWKNRIFNAVDDIMENIP
jgi:hypothetical protein